MTAQSVIKMRNYRNNMGSPVSTEEFIIRHSAFFQGIGFDVQYAAFIYYMLDLGYEDIIRYEREDDFVIDRMRNGKIEKEYYQVKHSKDKNAKMTDADSDFWKTIDNWVELYNVSETEEKDKFFIDGKFIILTNKIVDNKFYTSFEKLQNGICGIDDILRELKEARKSDPSYKPTLNKLLALEKNTLNQFLHKIRITRFENFLSSLYEQFLQKYLRPAVADQVLNQLIGAMWSDKINSNTPVELSGEQFTNKYRGILEKVSLGEKLTLEMEDEPNLDAENENEAAVMIEQLKSVEEIGKDSSKDDFRQAYYLGFFFRIKRAIESFRKQQIITDELEKRLDRYASTKWKGFFIKHHKQIMDNETGVGNKEKIKAGSNTLHDTLDTPIKVNGHDADDEFSKGWYLRMSNTLSVVWHYDWFKKYILKK